jgi:SAM-dependent methyltransferase
VSDPGDSPKCLLCGSTNLEIVAEEFRYPGKKTGYRCLACTLIFVHPLMTPDEERKFYEEEYGIIYSKEKNTTPKDLFQNRQADAKMYADWVGDRIGPNDDVLEIGCASGYFLDHIRPRVKSIAGTETHLELRQYCIDIGITMHESLAALPDASYDRVFAFFVLEHLGDPQGFLKEIKRILRPGGSIFLVVPNVDDVLLSTYDIPKFKAFYFTPAHQFYYSKKTMGDVFVKSGLPNFEILPKQRYDLSNHMHWMMAGRPGGMGKYKHVFEPAVDEAYAESLIKRWLCDTLFAVVKVD